MSKDRFEGCSGTLLIKTLNYIIKEGYEGLAGF
jgi:hypothetical protein